MDERLALTLANRRFTLFILGALAVLALVLALVGLFGVLAYTVGQRRRELALRVALGATGSDLIRLVMAHGMGMTSIGVGVGLVLASAITRVMSAQLFEVRPVDLNIYATVSLSLMAVAALASGIPAVRATRGDPVAALRNE